MAGKREASRLVDSFEFVLSHTDVVNLMNDSDVLLNGGHVLTTQPFSLSIRKQNGSEIMLSLRELQENDSLVFRFKQVMDVSDDTSYTNIDVSP